MTREEAINRLTNTLQEMRAFFFDSKHISEDDEKDLASMEMAIKALEQEPCEDMGEVSDGYHTFNQLYHQRAILFACIVNQNKNKAWKSFKHSDGKYCFDSNGEWFIVGVDTLQGSYTYHYAKEYWDMFDCQELECGKEWDGHTEEDVTRLLSLESSDWISVSKRLPKIAGVYRVTRYYPNNVMNPNYLVDACFFDGSNTWYSDNRINHERAYADNVIAWQENPEPYKAESEVRNE